MTRIVCVVLLVVIASKGIAHFRSLLNPVVAVCLPFAAALTAQALLIPEVPFGARAFLYVIAICGGFALGAALVAVPNRGLTVALHLRPGRRALAVGTGVCLTVVALYGSIYAGRIVGGSSAGAVAPGVFSRELALASLSSRDSLLLRAITIVVLFTGVYAMLLWRAGAPWSRILLGFSIAASVFLANSMRARLTTLIIFVLLVLTLLLTGRRDTTIATPSMATVLRALAAVVALVAGSFAVYSSVAGLRYGGLDDSKVFVVSAFGGPSALSVWMDEPGSVQELGADDGDWDFGVSVAGWLELVGIRERQLGQATPVGLRGSDPDSYTNVYTALFFLAQDFTHLGAVITMLLAGSGTAYVERRYRRAPTPTLLGVRIASYLVLATLPNMLLTYYNFWWLMLVGALFLPAAFVLTPTVRSREEPARKRRLRLVSTR